MSLICFSSLNILYAQSFEDNIISWWKFDEEIGSETFDATDFITGTTVEIIGDSIEWTEGIHGSALDLTNAVDTTILLIEDFDDIDFPTESFTISLWAKISMDLKEGVEQVLLCKGSIGIGNDHGPNGNGDRYMIAIKRFGGKFEIRFTTDDDAVGKTQLGIIPTDTIVADDWIHLMCVRDVDAKMLYLYMNGDLIGEMEDVAVEVNTEGQPLQIGNYYHRRSKFKGALDDIMIIDMALTETEAMELYENNFQRTGLIQINKRKDLVIAPNIVNNDLIIKNASSISKIEILNNTGQIIKLINNNKTETIRQDITDLPAGNYLVKGFNNKEISLGRFIKK